MVPTLIRSMPSIHVQMQRHGRELAAKGAERIQDAFGGQEHVDYEVYLRL